VLGGGNQDSCSSDAKVARNWVCPALKTARTFPWKLRETRSSAVSKKWPQMRRKGDWEIDGTVSGAHRGREILNNRLHPWGCGVSVPARHCRGAFFGRREEEEEKEAGGRAEEEGCLPALRIYKTELHCSICLALPSAAR